MNGRSGVVVAGVVALVFIAAGVIVALSLGSDLGEAAPLLTTLLALVGISIPGLLGLAKIGEVQTEQEHVKKELAQTRFDMTNGPLRENLAVALQENDIAKVDDVKTVVTEVKNVLNSGNNNRKAV